jgi:membrane protein implicated in regulation of membrane protease activity
MRRNIELASGIVLLVAGLFSLYLAISGRMGSCFVVGGMWFNYLVVYLITIIFIILGATYIYYYIRYK